MAEPGRHPGVRVERVDEGSWTDYRAVRLAALIDSPRAFWTTYAEAAARTDDQWRTAVGTGGPLWLAWDVDRPVGLVALWHAADQPEDDVHLVQMWVASSARGSGAATALVGAALAHARTEGRARISLDVARENVRARRFYLRQGFVPTGGTGVMPWDPGCVEERMVRDVDL